MVDKETDRSANVLGRPVKVVIVKQPSRIDSEQIWGDCGAKALFKSYLPSIRCDV